MRAGSTIALSLLAAWMLAAGCKSTAGSARSTTEVPEQGDLDTYLAALDGNASDLRAAGVTVPVAAAGPTDAPTTEADGSLGGEAAAEPALDEAESYDDDADADAAGGDAQPRIVEQTAKRDKTERRSNRCQRVCDLAEMACELEAKICDLASEHVGEDRYEQACERAQTQCEAASNACTGCA